MNEEHTRPPREPQRLTWARELQALAQNGLAFTRDPYDRQRYERIRVLALEMLAAGSEDMPETLQRLWREETGYATPKVAARAAVFRDDTILLVRDARDGRWTLPGGWIDVNESPREAVEREVLEETGYVARADKLLILSDKRKQPHPPSLYHAYDLFFHCVLLAGAPATNLEVSEIAFFPETALPALHPAMILPEQITRLFAHARHPEWPTDFD